LDLNGASVTLLPEGALWQPAEGLLAVADLHFEKGSYFARRGQFLPPYDTRATLYRLAQLCLRYRPETVIALGDSFHDRQGPERLADEDRRRLCDLTNKQRWIWIAGNHDADAAAACGGYATDEHRAGPLVFRHEPVAYAGAGEAAGHLHPKAAVSVKGRRIGRRCFVSDGRRIVLPAFGAYTGGLDVFNAAFFPLFPQGFQAYLLGRDRVYPFQHSRLAA
jgi:DNA ligase-associated metallophosphoesterase